MLQRYRVSMVRSERDRLSRAVEVDETLVGGIEKGGKRGRGTSKSIIVIAVEVKEPKGFGRIRMRRLFAASEVKAIGHGGIKLVWKATGMARDSIQQGLKELSERAGAIEVNSRRIRRVGAGRKISVKEDTQLLSALECLVEPVTRGDPESPLRWTCKSLRQLESELLRQGYAVSHTSIGELLKKEKKWTQ